MNRFAYFGVAAAWDAGYAFGEEQFRVRDETAAGKHPNAARYLTAGRGLTTPAQVRGANWRQSTFPVGTQDDGRWAVRQLAARKVPIVKYWVDDTPRDVYAAVIDEAHKHNMRVVTGGGKDEMGWLQAGADGWAHSPSADDEMIAALKEAKTKGRKVIMLGFTTINGTRRWNAPYYSPVAPLLLETVHPALIKQAQDQFTAIPPPQREKDKKGFQNLASEIKKLVACQCIPIGFGADGGGRMNPPSDKWVGWTVHMEMSNLVMAGMTPMQVLVSATKTSAENLGLHDLGMVAQGKSADFVVLDANPLDEITNTQKINKVYLRGREIDRAGLRAGWSKWFATPR
jgi:hypothetical protein